MKAMTVTHLSMWHVLTVVFMFVPLDNAFGTSCAELQQEKQALVNRWNAARSNFAANPYGGAESNWQAMLARLQQLNFAIANCNNGASQQPPQPQAVDIGQPTIIGVPTIVGQPTPSGPQSRIMDVVNAAAGLNEKVEQAEGMLQLLPEGASLSSALTTPAPQPVPQPPPGYADQDPALQTLRRLANEPTNAVSAPATAPAFTSRAPASPQGFNQTQLNNLRSNVGGLSPPPAPTTSNTSAAPTMAQQPQVSGYQTCVGTFANPPSYCQMGNYIYFQNGTSLKIQ